MSVFIAGEVKAVSGGRFREMVRRTESALRTNKEQGGAECFKKIILF
jgi:hypothetical protein